MKKEVNIWLMGGFGNVLFQLFIAHLLKKEGHNISLSTLLTKKNIYTNTLGWTIHDQAYRTLLNDYNENKHPEIPPLFVAGVSKYINIGKNYSFFYRDLDNLLKNPSTNIFGYFQNKDFLEKNKEELIIFSRDIASKIQQNQSLKNNQACIHIRLGDSTWAKNNLDYYKKALDYLPNDINLTIVTDSIEAAKDLIPSSRRAQFSNSDDVLEDFHLLFSSNIIICAPSTFSWWAAHCAKKAEIIIAPKSLYDQLGIYLDETELILL